MVLFLKILAGLVILIVAGLSIATYFIARDIKQTFPPTGVFKTINSAKLHYVDTGKIENNSRPAVIFIHGAGGNLNDPMPIYKKALSNKFRAIFLDRPGQGYSESFEDSNDVPTQTSSIAKLMDELAINKAIIVGHSFGGALASTFGVLYPEKTAGLILLAPVTHPWETGVDWHYDLGNTPVIGWLFSRTLAPVAGHFIYPNAIKRLFLPNPMPIDYKETSATKLALLPENFHSNAKDIARVHKHVEVFQNRYNDIVSLEIHSINGLSKDIKNSKLFVLDGVGHKPDYVAADQIVKSIQEIADQN
ncbi:AB hydrolase superfamily protein YvaM [Nymphon striatum]|nr:AB hydrolase superfamily protein YvaM [Nymphon striatum]